RPADAVRTPVSLVWRALACALAASAGTVVGGAVAEALGASLPAVPVPAEPGRAGLLFLVASLGLAVGVAPLASGLAVEFRARWAILAALAYVCLGVNTAIEAAIFTRVGGTAGMLVFNLFTAAALAAA